MKEELLTYGKLLLIHALRSRIDQIDETLTKAYYSGDKDGVDYGDDDSIFVENALNELKYQSDVIRGIE